MAGAAFGDILGDSRNAKSKMGRVRSPKRRVRDDDFMVGSWSDYPRNLFESSFYWRKQFTEFPLNYVELTDFMAGAVFGEVGG